MNAYDIFLIAIVVVSVVAGAIKGLVREVFSLVGVVLGLMLALVLSPTLVHELGRIIPYETAAYAAGFLLIFVTSLFVMSLAGALLTKLLDIAHLGLPNRVLGGLFGVLRGVLTALVLTVGLTLFLDEDAAILGESRLVPYLAWGTRALAPFLPAGVEEVLEQRLNGIPEDAETMLGT